ncbi:unnamed protein product, partial [Prorocentrum cordatum]
RRRTPPGLRRPSSGGGASEDDDLGVVDSDSDDAWPSPASPRRRRGIPGFHGQHGGRDLGYAAQTEAALVAAALALSAREAAGSPAGDRGAARAAEEEEAQLQEALRLSRYEALRAALPMSAFPGRCSEACGGAGGEAQECPICLVEFEQGDRVLRLECLHLFHEKCVDSWLQKRLDCPVCQTSFAVP